MLKHALKLLLCFYCAHGFADDCALLSLKDLESALPQYSPWQVQNGGAGACQFVGEQRSDEVIDYASLSLTQQINESTAEATEMYDSVAREFAKVHDLQKPDIGPSEQSFAFSALDDGQDWNVWVQKEQLILHAQLLGPGARELNADTRAALQSLTAIALNSARQPEVQAQAQSCPYFDAALLEKLFPDQPAKVQQFGENSCMAQNDRSDVLMLTMVEADPQMLEQMRIGAESDCTVADLKDLELGFISFGCASGNANVSIRFMLQARYFDLNFVPEGREPTEQEREHLIALARKIAAP